jgi:hypothetical protein
LPAYSQLARHDNPIPLDATKPFDQNLPSIETNYKLLWQKIEELRKLTGQTTREIHNITVAGPGAIDHTLLNNLNSAAYYHLTQIQYNAITGAGDTALHYHAADRARVNHTGTQVAATISDFQAAARLTINAAAPVLYDNLTGTISLAGLGALGAANQILGMNALGTAYEYKTLAGTANQVNIAHGVGSVTLSLPQDIAATSSPTFNNLTINGDIQMATGNWIGLAAAGQRLEWNGPAAELEVFSNIDMNSYDIAHGGNIHSDAGKFYADTETANTLVYLDAAKGLTTLGAATNGQVAIGSTGAAPLLASITGTANQITVTNGAGSITLSAPQDLHSGASPIFAGLTLSNQLTSTLATGTAPLVIASTTVCANLNADLWDGYQFADYLDQAVKTTSSPTFATVKCTILTNGYLPYHVADATGLADSIIYTANSKIGIGTAGTEPTSLLEVYSASLSPVLTITGAHATDYDPAIAFRTDASPTQKARLGVDSTDDSFRVEVGTGTLGARNDFVMNQSNGNIGFGVASSTEKVKVGGIIGTTDSAGTCKNFGIRRAPFFPMGSPHVLDLTTTDAALKGFYGGFTDGRYGYFVPWDNGAYFGKVARVDLNDFSTVSVLDLTTTDAALKGFVGGFTDGRYGYFVPYDNGARFGKVARIQVSFGCILNGNL